MAVTEKKIPLIEPIEVNGKKVSELTMKKMTVGMMLDANVQAMNDYGIEPTSAMVEPYAFGLACDVPVGEILGMGWGPEYQRLQVASRFLMAGGKQEDTAEEKSKDTTDKANTNSQEKKESSGQ